MTGITRQRTKGKDGTIASFKEQVEEVKETKTAQPAGDKEREVDRRDTHREWILKKKRLPPPSSVMAMSHQLWMSGRPHGPHRWENQGPGQSGPGHLSSLPRGR